MKRPSLTNFLTRIRALQTAVCSLSLGERAGVRVWGVPQLPLSLGEVRACPDTIAKRGEGAGVRVYATPDHDCIDITPETIELLHDCLDEGWHHLLPILIGRRCATHAEIEKRCKTLQNARNQPYPPNP